MSKGIKILLIVLGVLLALTIFWSVVLTEEVIELRQVDALRTEFDIFIAGVGVTTDNMDDVLGDGTVSYNPSNNTLTFDNATIEHDNAIIHTSVDLLVKLVGENKFLCKNAEYIPALCASDYLISKDLLIYGDGSLVIDFENVSTDMMGIYADTLTIAADVTVNTSDCSNILNAVVCDSMLLLKEGATLTVNSATSAYSTALGVRGNLLMEPNATLIVNAKPGVTEACKGICVDGDLVMGKDSTLQISVDDESAVLGECITVSGVLDVAPGATLKATATKTYGIECYGTLLLRNGATVSAFSGKQSADILCYGAMLDEGATINANIEALGGVKQKQ